MELNKSDGHAYNIHQYVWKETDIGPRKTNYKPKADVDVATIKTKYRLYPTSYIKRKYKAYCFLRKGYHLEV